jgi:hypothetical protein
VLNRVVVLSLVGPDAAHVEIGSPVIRPILYRRLELLEGVVQSTLLLVQGAKIVVRFGIVRIDLERGAKRRLCVLQLAAFEKEHAVIVVKVGLISIESETSPVVLGRLFVLIQPAME